MTEQALPTHRLVAFNTSHASENKIHEDAVAKRLGFSGGLVPGTDVYAYMTHAPVGHWGRAWLDAGFMHVRLAKPVYDGAETAVEAVFDDDGGMRITTESQGQVCAVATARLNPGDRPASLPKNPDGGTLPDHDRRPPAGADTLAEGTALAAICDGAAREHQAGFLGDVREDLGIYQEQGLVHPGYLLRRANYVLRRNVMLGPWIHVESSVWNMRALTLDEPFSTHAVVAGNYERKGHLFVDLDVLMAARAGEPVCRVHHKAIYVPRQLRSAA